MWFQIVLACAHEAADQHARHDSGTDSGPVTGDTAAEDPASDDTATDSADTALDCEPTVETCNALDDDCDGLVDEEAVDASTWYADTDGDGWGDEATATVGCELPAGVTRGGDCNDADPLVVTRCDGTVLGDPDGTLVGADVERLFYSTSLLDGAEAIVATTSQAWGPADALPGDAVVGAAQLAVFEYPDASAPIGTPVVLGDGTQEAVFVGDLDGDGTDDLLATTWDGEILLDGGDGWTPAVGNTTLWLLPGPLASGASLPVPSWSSELSLTVDDPAVAVRVGPALDGLSVEELFVAEYMGIRSVDTVTGISTARLTTAEHPWSFAADDLDGDGSGDLAWIQHDEVKINLGPWTEESRSGDDADVTWLTEGFGSTAVHSGDFDDDGTPELVFVQRDGIYLLPASGGGDASGSGAPHLAMRDGDDLSFVHLAVADTNGDHVVDLLVGDWNTGGHAGDLWTVLGPILGAIELDDADARVSGAGGDELGSGVAFGAPGDIVAGAEGAGEVRLWTLPE